MHKKIPYFSDKKPTNKTLKKHVNLTTWTVKLNPVY